MLYQIRNGTVSMGGNVILSHVDFQLKGNEKIAIVGRNAAGKTTLLRLIAGELSLDRDDKRQEPGVVKYGQMRTGMLRQVQTQDKDQTVEELLLEGCPVIDLYSKERFLYEREYDRMFTGLGFSIEDKKRRLQSFSGGEQTKIALIQLLLQKPDVLLLDEPTNHLDLKATEWLENYIRSYPKAVVMVSHDRFFLDQVVGTVYELADKTLTRYAGNYSNYREAKRHQLAIQKKNYERQQEEIRRLNELIEKFRHKPKKAAFARSRKTMLERMERVEKPTEDVAVAFTVPLEPEIRGSKWVFEAEHMKIGYDKVLSELSIRIRRGQKIAVIGENGAGKTTFLKTVAGLLEPLDGGCALGDHTVIGYFDQHTAAIRSQKSVREHFHALFPAMQEKEVRQVLGSYLFRGDQTAKRVDDLSGGEKSRLVLAEILTARPNLLVLDEPTNHMDIPAKETLESAFGAYQGTILFASHDRYLIQMVADALLVFEGQSVLYYPFGYAHYLERKRNAQGEELTALIQAEDAAMIAGLKAVPKAERHRLREIGTEEAYADWKLGLAAQPMEAAREKVEGLWEQLIPDQQDYERALEEWTQECLLWYDTYRTVKG